MDRAKAVYQVDDVSKKPWTAARGTEAKSDF